MIRFATALALLLATTTTAAGEGAPAVRVLPLPKRPSADRIRQFFAGGVAIDSSFYRSDGSANFFACCVPSATCASDATWRATASTIGFRCDDVEMTGGGPGEDGKPVRWRGEPYAELLQVRLVSPRCSCTSRRS
jgi:hypothetical protein